MFRKLYNWTLNLAKHPRAEKWLGVIGFTESIVFPIPADIILAPMCLGHPHKAYRYALILSIASVVGGIVGYFIGYFFSDLATYLVDSIGKVETLNSFKRAFEKYGIILVFIAGFSPFPYKIVTIGAGLLHVAFPLFFIGSVLSRPLRFFLVAWAIKKGGENLEQKISQYIELLGWVCLISVALVIICLYINK